MESTVAKFLHCSGSSKSLNLKVNCQRVKMYIETSRVTTEKQLKKVDQKANTRKK